MHYGGRLCSEELRRRDAAAEERVRATAGVLPCYGLGEWSGLRMIGDWQWEDGVLVTVGLAHGARDSDGPTLQVLTTVKDPRRHVASLRLDAPGGPWDADTVHDRLRELETAVDEPAVTTVDGDLVPVTVWRHGQRWWAASRDAGYGLVLEARGMPIDCISLARIHDIEPYILGRRAYLRARRSEP
jgi:hypothetical protein